jgi:hypothetical protein
MYRHCIHCTADLGVNDVVESFPIGARVAWDASRGRLWAICGQCGRWNLSPLEERWEALDECERAFRTAGQIIGTEHIGRVRHASGLELVRIGAAPRVEFAAWRYGAALLRRWWRTRVENWATSGAGFAASALSAPVTWPIYLPAIAWHVHHQRKIVAQFPSHERVIAVSRSDARRIRLKPNADGAGWHLVVRGRDQRTAVLHGDEAVRAAGILLPHINRQGATELQVKVAVRELERHGTGADYFAASSERVSSQALFGNREHAVRRAPAEIRLALEMAAHEEVERRAVEGELKALESAWREAEEIAAIADNLLLPSGVRHMLQRLRSSD